MIQSNRTMRENRRKEEEENLTKVDGHARCYTFMVLYEYLQLTALVWKTVILFLALLKFQEWCHPLYSFEADFLR